MLVSAGLALTMTVVPGLEPLVARGAGTPDGAVNALLDVVIAKQFDQIGPLVCESRRDELIAEFDLVRAFSSDGIDAQPLVDAMTLTVDGRDVSVVSEEGDDSTVHVDGTLRIAVDENAAKEWLRTSLEALGQSADDATIDQFLSSIMGRLGNIPVSSDVDVVREDGQWLVCDRLQGDLPGETFDAAGGLASCDLITADELNTLSAMVFAPPTLDAGWCSYNALDATNDFYSVILRLEDGDLESVKAAFPDGADATIAGLPAWGSSAATWVDIGDQLLVVQPLLMGADSAEVDPIAFAAAIANIAIPRLHS